MSNTETQYGSVNYWLQLHQFYSKKSSMSVTLVDSDGKVMIKVIPALDPNAQGRPQAGVAAFNYKAALNFTLNIAEIQAIITAYRRGMLMNEQLSFIHMKESGHNICSISFMNGYFSLTVNSGGNSLNHAFMNHKLNKDSSTFINHEFELFVNMLDSVIKNIVDIKAKQYPVFVPKNNGQQGYNNSGSGYSQPQQNNYQQAPQHQTYQQPQQNNGLPQSNNGQQSNNSFAMNDDF